MSTEDNFKLDNRSIEWHLEHVLSYSALIPFIGEHSDNGNWKDILQAQGVSLQQLALLYRDLQQANGKLAPQQAFLLAFLQLLETPRRLFNDLPAAHRQFYYRGLLRLQEQKARPDSAVVIFHSHDEGQEVLIPQDTLLDGGQTEEGSSLVYHTTAPILVNSGQIAWCADCWPADAGQLPAKLRTLYREGDVNWSQKGARLFVDNDEQTQMVYGGRAISSPALWGASGLRQITVTFDDDPVLAEAPLLAEISGETGWLTLEAKWDEDKLLLELPEDRPAISAPSGLDQYYDRDPVLRIRREYGQALPEITELTMTISGATHVAMSTDDSITSPLEGGYPFGGEPTLGRGVNLMAPEWGNGILDVDLEIRPQWLDLPKENFHAWYVYYDNRPDGNEDFTVQAMYCNRQGENKIDEPKPLFAGEAAPMGETLKLTLNAVEMGYAGNQGDNNPVAWSRWLRLVLTGSDFLHQEYQKGLLEGTILEPPYTPQITGLQIKSICTDQTIFQQYILTPLGYYHETPGVETLPDEAVPQLLLGIRDIQPGQQLSLYWRLWGVQPISLQWQYLAKGNHWRSLNFAINDATDGLFYADLWGAVLPSDIANDQQRMPPALYWLRALFPPMKNLPTVDTDVSGYPRLWRVAANAVRVTLDNHEPVDASHFRAPLPPHSITALLAPIDGVAEIEQPWPSEGGRAAENETQFFQRIAQRLRHRQRVVTRDDVIDVLMGEFLELYQVRWVDYDDAQYLARFIVLPLNGRQDNDDHLRPRFSPERLQRMTDFVRLRGSPWAYLQLRNPEYVDIFLHYRVSFQASITPDFGYSQLESALEQRYMPWATDNVSSVHVGEQLNYYDILAFIQRQSWVQNVEVLRILRETGNDHIYQAHEIELLATEVAILNICIEPTVWENREKIQ